MAGTSYAAAYVSGALALMLAQYPGQTHQQIISLLLSATDPVPALAGKCLTGGRLDLRKALSRPLLTVLPALAGDSPQFRVSAGSNRTFIIEAAPDLLSWSPILTNTTTADGYFDFSDTQTANLPSQFYRAVCTR